MTERFVEITWLDAARHTEEHYYDLKTKSPKEFLVERTGYGKLLNSDKHGYVIMTDKDEDGQCEVDVIPAGMVTKISIQEKE